jgi:hypothetical protein
VLIVGCGDAAMSHHHPEVVQVQKIQILQFFSHRFSPRTLQPASRERNAGSIDNSNGIHSHMSLH